MVRADVVFVALLDAAWIAASPFLLPFWPEPVRAALLTAAVLALPGAAWDWTWRTRSRVPGIVVARIVALSTVWLIALLVIVRLAHLTPTALGAWTTLGIVVNAGGLSGWLRRARLRCPRALAVRERWWTAAIACAALALVGAAATRIVPPLVDHDLEAQGPAYALVTRLEPRFLSDRRVLYYFAHPPLAHFYVGASFLYRGEIDALQKYEAMSRDASGPADEAAPARIAHAFFSDPRLAAARATNVAVAALTTSLMALWAFRRSRRWWMAWLVSGAYLSNPEVLVRSAADTYFSLSVFAAVLVFLAADAARNGRRAGWAAFASAWAALVNHKLGVALAGMAAGLLASGSHPARAGAHLARRAIAAGFLAGTAVFWAYGLAIAPSDFIADHLRHHFWDRLSHQNPLGYEGYLSIVSLWREFIAHTGVVLLPVAAASAAMDLRRPGRARATTLMLLGSVAATSLAFSIVDWRMTKHLMPSAFALFLLLVPSRAAPGWRVGAGALTCAWLLAWNAAQVSTLARDFSSFVMRPGW